MRPCSSTNTPSPKPVCAPADPSSLNYHSPIFCEDFIVSDTLHETNYPDDNNDRPWWGLPCTVPCTV
ncbi:type IV toxin-antitoxin system YeeU family antitoxin, partial [Escherichia coli]